ncbi:MAG: hypothetical protein HYS24_11785 [Ignavibacteriales bacterium]|jgi:hypothetical protein|nr:hypothetical protein [Ignavibacteriales bacterium]MBK7980756.1 hypothetical protein [Ignavibacteriota bacterium]
MKNVKIIFSLFILIYVWACSSKPKPNLELFSPEAFAFDVDNSWEVNATVNAKGFSQFDADDKPGINLFYKVDLITPANDTIKGIFDKSILMNEKKDIMDLQLEAQIELDSTFTSGEYNLVFNVSDEISKQTKSILIPFTLEN